jgi:hypothetical protein
VNVEMIIDSEESFAEGWNGSVSEEQDGHEEDGEHA